jgi:hypothetical protein
MNTIHDLIISVWLSFHPCTEINTFIDTWLVGSQCYLV